jgi:hypothetical protein
MDWPLGVKGFATSQYSIFEDTVIEGWDGD